METFGFTENQLKALAIIPSVVCPMSIVGSATIVYMIYVRGERRFYHRLMLVISIVDIFTSGVFMFGPMPVPKSTGAFLARGNTATCEFAGFASQLSISNMLYNMFLMLTFVKIVRYGQKEEVLSARYETFIHIFALGIPILSGVAGILLDVFNPVPGTGLLRCYIAAYPPGCASDDSIECTRGANFRMFLAISALLLSMSLVLMFGSIFLICLTVRQNDKRSRRLSQHNVRNTNRTIAVQAIIYGIFFFNTYVWGFLGPIVDLVFPGSDGSVVRIALRFLTEIFYGWQGFFNFFIYVRPRYIRIRSYRDDQSAFWALQEAVFGVTLEDSRYHSTTYSRQPNNPNSSKASFRNSRSFQLESGDSSFTPQVPIPEEGEEPATGRSLRVQADGSLVSSPSVALSMTRDESNTCSDPEEAM